MSMLLMALSLAAAPVAAHEIGIDHGGTVRRVTYQAHLDVEHRQKGFVPAGRTGTMRCDWTATIKVHRQIAGGANRVLADGRRLRGSRPGDCVTNRQAIAKAIAARQSEVRRHLLAVADHDHALLLAELGAAGAGAHAR